MDTEIRGNLREWLRWGMRLALAAAVVYVSWVFYQRWEAARDSEAARLAKEKARASEELQRAGGARLKITQFYASPSRIRKGDAAQLCYGVVFAEKVSLRSEPEGEKLDAVWPSLLRCVEVRPRVTTQYTLVATDKAGVEVLESQSVEVR
jgi:hypothetical protein